MTLSPARRRLVDRVVAAALAIVVVLVGVLLYLTSDLRATADQTAPGQPAPERPTQLPETLTQRWTLPTDPRLGAVASPYGVVITADDHGVTGFDAVTAERRWSYGRSNLELCAIGSGDTDAPGVDRRGRVRGLMTVFAKDGACSQVMLLDPATGERHYVRTSPNQPGGSLAFGGPYAGWLGPSLVELWRDDLVRTIQYGEQPQPPKGETLRSGCRFTDLALAEKQFATVEHCPDQGPNARVVINWATPADAPDKPEGQDVFKHDPRAEIDTGAPAARIVGITADRVAVLVSAPEPAVVVYDANGIEASRTPVGISADAVQAADVQVPPGGRTEVTPTVQDGDTRFSMIGSHLLAVTSQSIDVQVTPTPSTTAGSPSLSASPASSSSPSSPSSPSSSVGIALPNVLSTADDEGTVTKQIKDLVVDWAVAGALGLPAMVGEQLLMPVDTGLAALARSDGSVSLTLPVDRGGYDARVDAAAIGPMIVETRGDQVVGLS